MCKTFFAAFLAVVLLFSVQPASAGAGGTTFSNLKLFKDSVTVEISSTMITTKKYNFSFDSDSLTPTSPGHYSLNLIVNKVEDTFPSNSTSDISETVRLKNPVIGPNFLSVHVVGSKDGLIPEDSVVYLLGSEFSFDFIANNNVWIDDSGPLDEQPDTSAGPDLIVLVPKIEAVKIFIKGTGWVKRFKVTAEIINQGDEDAEGQIVFNYRGPLPNKYNPDDGDLILRSIPSVTKVVSRNGLSAGTSIKSTFYVSKSHANKMYLLSVDPHKRIDEAIEDNNDIVINMAVSNIAK